MISALHLIMIVAAASSLCCVLGSRRTRSVTAVGGTVLMAAAMADLAFGLVGLAPLGWTAILLGWAMVAAGVSRWRQGRAAAESGAESGAEPALDGSAAGRRHLHVVHQLGLVVVAGQIALCATMAGRGSAPGAGTGMTHPHSGSIFVAVVCVAGALFVLAAAAMVLVGQRSRPERGNLLSMSVMTAAMAVMPFG
ncbi:hypothetical protein BJQ94_07745 [Cryobacterium sp. SO2]|uniref:hypothetical protein n=1 Tax=Cryobacterium sp. SO2 TaxID=1897060 RepID=UPI00223CD933|nr:hypothetical protein [Cryobacterium sp. SO2]WEO78917.1 hypothetical protein BJQ94_07745 [Cryobacterium sp. SO2]